MQGLFKKYREVVIVICSVTLTQNFLSAQLNDATIQLLYRLDSVSKSPSVSRHFASIYFQTTVNAIDFFSKQDKKGQELIQRLELKFADYFFVSANACKERNAIADQWKEYYADTAGSSLVSILHGVNAHINGDIWPALVDEFSYTELQELKKYYFRYFDKLSEIYDMVYEKGYKDSRNIRLLHILTLGYDKKYGKMMLSRWRKRQWRLAELYFTNKKLFEKKRSVLVQKMQRINKLIYKNI